MAWRPEVFFRAFQRAGMLCQAVYLPAGVATPFAVSFLQPDVPLLGDQHQGTEYLIEYETTAVPTLRVGDQLQITDELGATATYTVREHAQRQGHGHFSRAPLAKP